MLRQFSGGGSSRSRGIKPKDALHISLILAVSIWILYHLTYTYQDNNNSLFDSFMPLNSHQEHKIHQHSVNGFTDKTDTGNTIEHEKDKESKNDDREGEIRDRIKEHEARERSFKDDDASSSVLHDDDDQMMDVVEELESGIITYPQEQNLTNDFILGNGNINGTINGSDVEKNISLSHLGNFSVKPDEIDEIED